MAAVSAPFAVSGAKTNQTQTPFSLGGKQSLSGAWRDASGQIDPYKSQWTTGSWQGMSQPTGGGGDLGDGSEGGSIAQTGLPLGTDKYWKDLGFEGTPYSSNGGSLENGAVQDLSPELRAWAQERGYQPGFTEGYGGLVTGGQVVPGSAFGNRTNDDATFIAGALGLGGAGLAANSAGLGVDAAGNATGGAFGGGAESLATTSSDPWAAELAAGTPTEATYVGADGALAGNADKAALLGDAGYGTGMTGLETGAADAALGTGSSSMQLPQWMSDFGSNFGQAANKYGANMALAYLLQKASGKPPAAPDYGALNQQQTQSNQETAAFNANLNRVNTTTPYGSQTFGQVADASAPGGFRPTSTISLSPEQQALYEKETSNQLGMQDLAGQFQGRVGQAMATPFSLSGTPKAEGVNSDPNAFGAQRDQVTQAVYDRTTRLLEPQMQRARAQMDTRLKNQGLMPGTEAYDAAMKSLMDAQAGQLSDAANQAIAAGGAEQTRLNADIRQNAGFNNQNRSQGIQEQLLERQQPLTEFNSLRTGNTPTLPQFQPFGMASAQPTNLGATAQMQYNANADSYNAKVGQYQNLLNLLLKTQGGG